MTTGKEVEYTGKFIDAKDGFIAVNNDGKLVFEQIKDK